LALHEPRPGNELLREQLERFSHSSELGRSKRLLRFLQFTVEQSLSGAAESLSEYSIGRAVYDRPETFDPLTDGIVRVEVHRLRAKLRDYYTRAGQHDPLIIDYPVGSYVPVFRSSGPEFLPQEGRIADAIRSKDWSTSPLGPIRDWPRALKMTLSIALRTKFPVAVCWGPQFISIFNDAMHAVIGEEGTSRLGRPLADVEDNWSQLESVFRRVVDHNETVYWDKNQWLSVRHGFEREAYFTVSFSPIIETGSAPLGVLIMATEVTNDVLYERRNRTLTELSTIVPDIGETEGCREVMRALEQNPYDVPFATMYLFDAARSQAELRGNRFRPAGGFRHRVSVGSPSVRGLESFTTTDRGASTPFGPRSGTHRRTCRRGESTSPNGCRISYIFRNRRAPYFGHADPSARPRTRATTSG